MMTSNKFRFIVFTAGCALAALILGFSFNAEMNLKERTAPSHAIGVNSAASQVDTAPFPGMDLNNFSQDPSYVAARKKILDLRNFALIGLAIVCLMVMSV
jgi:hypothetical protein